MITGVAFIVVGIASVLAAFFFFTSKDGELRKILIWKFATNAITFITLGVYSLEFGLPDWISLFVVPYLVVKFWLLKYLVKNIK